MYVLYGFILGIIFAVALLILGVSQRPSTVKKQEDPKSAVNMGSIFIFIAVVTFIYAVFRNLCQDDRNEKRNQRNRLSEQ